ncbi:MAG TPA: putative porin [Vicinamibacteria bacterium]|nr:putative porin [Vicinamibacteria bacterium]HRB12650.1 putative porin [Vicinamibacteria bacterium]
MNIKAASRITRLALLLVPALAAVPASAQQQKQAPITGDIIIRQEWTDDFFTTPDPVPSSRTRFWIRPKFEIETSMLRMGLGVDASYSTDDNLEPENVALPLTLIRDNYLSRNIRLDIAYLGTNLGAIKVDAGRMPMPFRLTNMIWDQDLRIQGGAAQWTLYQGSTAEPMVKASGIYSRGSHVFADSEDPDGSSLGEGVTVAGGSLDLGFGENKRVDFTGTYLQFDKLNLLEPMIRRQNTRVGGVIIKQYEVVDLILRFRTNAPIPIQVVVNGARNLETETLRDGFWVTAVLGSLVDGKIRGEYTYAKVDRDVTVAAYAGDDFFWGTGWLGHKAELAFAQSAKATFHVIGQMQQFKDSANLAERSHWVKRLRLEVRKKL